MCKNAIRRLLLAGTLSAETISALPAMGRLTVEAILFRDDQRLG